MAQYVQPRRAAIDRFLPRAAVVFIFAWTIYTLTVTGNAVLTELYRPLLHSSPSANQYAAGDPFAKAIAGINRQIPSTDSVLIVWPDNLSSPSVNSDLYWYAIIWGSFWLYPRPVTVTIHPDSVATSDATTIIELQRFGDAAPPMPPAYRAFWSEAFPGANLGKDPPPPGYVSPGVTISVYRR